MIGADFRKVLEGAQAGDKQAIATLWRAYHPRLLRFLRGMEPRAAEDIASETWLGVMRDVGRFSGTEGAFAGWLFTVARNRLVDWRRRDQRRLTVGGVDYELEVRAAGDDPAGEALAGVATEAAIQLVRQLPPDQAEVVLLRVLADLDTAQVAEIVGKRVGAVRVLQHRGLRRLAELLESPGALEALRRRE